LSTNPESSPFLLEDVQLFVGKHRFDVRTYSDPDPDPDLVSAAFIIRAFTNQKTRRTAKSSVSDAVPALPDAKINAPSTE
jgi:hypothetical protein